VKSATQRPRYPDYVVPDGAGRWKVRCRVQPAAKDEAAAGLRQGRLKIRLRAPAVDNKANKAAVLFLASLLKVKKSQVRLESGRTSRDKTFVVETEKPPAWPDVAGEGGDQP
jgi:hypothetical protein